MNSNLSYSPETPNLGQIQRFLEPCDLEMRWITLKNNRAPFLCYFKLCTSFRSHWWIQTGVTVRNRPIWVKIEDFLSWTFAWTSLLSLVITPENFMIRWEEHFEKGVTDGQTEIAFLRAAWSQLTIGHLIYAASSFVQHFIAVGEFKMELQSGNAQFRSKSMIFLVVWPWNLMNDLQKL